MTAAVPAAFPPPALVPPPPERTAKLTKIADVRPQPIRWLVPGLIPYNAMTILAGRPGQGKSQLVMSLAADLSRQGIGSLLIGAEDALEDTVRPRLKAAGANLELIQGMAVETGGDDDMPLLPEDIPLVTRAVKDIGAGLVVVDPVQAHLSPDLNTSNDHSLRRAMAPLARMARTTGAAVICVTHFKKSRDGSPMDWVGGSVGFIGQARSVLLLGKNKHEEWYEQDTNRYLVHVKCNGAKLGTTRRCVIESTTIVDSDLSIDTSRVWIEDEVSDVWAYDLE